MSWLRSKNERLRGTRGVVEWIVKFSHTVYIHLFRVLGYVCHLLRLHKQRISGSAEVLCS